MTNRIDRATEYRLLTGALQQTMLDYSRTHKGIDSGVAFVCFIDVAVAIWLEAYGDLSGLLASVKQSYEMHVN